MLHVIDTATDVAEVCFFDAAALPADFDQRIKTGDLADLQELTTQGTIWFQNTGSDGSYLFHFYIEEEIPERISKFCSEPKTLDVFSVPSGKIWACGTEFASADPLNDGLGKHSKMGGSFSLAPGKYKVTAWRVEWPEKLLEEEYEKQLGKNYIRNNTRFGCLTAFLLFFAPSLTIFTVFKTLTTAIGETGRLVWFWFGTLLAWAAFVLSVRIVSRMEKNPLKTAVEREFPNIVIQMVKLP